MTTMSKHYEVISADDNNTAIFTGDTRGQADAFVAEHIETWGGDVGYLKIRTFAKIDGNRHEGSTVWARLSDGTSQNYMD